MVPQIIFMLVALLLMNGADMGPGRAYTAVFLLVLAQFSEGFVGSGVWTKSLDISKRYSTLAHGFMNGLGCAARPDLAELSPSRHSDADLLHVMSVFSTRSHLLSRLQLTTRACAASCAGTSLFMPCLAR